jgi:hypothetical protein
MEFDMGRVRELSSWNRGIYFFNRRNSKLDVEVIDKYVLIDK